MIRVSKISTKFANTAKKEKLDLFLAEYNQWLRFYIDADMNGAKNNSIQLSVISRRFMAENNNRGNGFFWSQHGVFSDKEFTVPYTKQTKSKS